MQVNGKKILFDPVLSGSVSPVSFTNRSFMGTDPYGPDDIPEVDYLFISHDHWDHLDYKTMLAIKPKVKKVICALGVGSHLEYWGFSASDIIEMDWNDRIILDEGFIVHAVTSRHFSGRTLKRNRTLWASFVLQTPTHRIFMGCDGGYDKHFAETGRQFGSFDLAILENGQYNKYWKNIHMMPAEVIQAAKDLNTKAMIPVHSCKFALANHTWDDPLKTITELNRNENLNIQTPIIGDLLYFDQFTLKSANWWEKVN
jgi:L-ascorbate metabolism protein UlaG (beta-lactamase superfamily)